MNSILEDMENFISPTQLSSIIAEFFDFIQQQWLFRVRSQIHSAKDLSDSDIVDLLPKYLVELVQALRNTDLEDPFSGSNRTAREHGEARAKIGYSVREVAAEYSILLEIILEKASALGSVSFETQAFLNRINDAALINSVEEFLSQTVISEERQARYKAEDSQKLLHDFFMQAPEPMVILSGPTHIFTAANQPYIDFIGRDPIGRSVRDVFTNEEAGAFFGILDEVYATGIPYVGKEMLFRRKNDKGAYIERWVNFGYYPSRDQDDQITGIHAFVYDVTEIEKARKWAEQSEARVRKYAEAMPQMAFIANHKGEITYFNSRFYEYTGLKVSQGREWENQQIHHPDDLQRTIETWSHAVRTGEPYEIEYRLKRHDGQYRWHLGRAIPDKDENGKIIEWFGTNTDIHDQKTQAEESKLRERLLLLTTNAVPVLISYMDRDLRYRFVNSAYESWFGVPTSHFVGKRVVDMVGADVFNKVQERFARAFRGESLEFEEEAHYPHGTRQIHVSYSPDIDEETKEVRGVVALVQDVSEKKHAEEELRRAKMTAEEANRAKSSFLANISHEIRTPIGVILGFAELLMEHGSLEPEQKQWVDTIRRNSRQLTSVIGEVLDLSKVEADKLEIEHLEFSLPDVVEDISAIMRFKSEEKGISFRINVASDVPKKVKSDPTRLRQILINVIGNAIKFTERGSVQVNFESTADPTLVCVRVSDTGIGMTAEQQARIFEPFMQGDSSMTRRFGGTGLGLAIAKRLAEALGGGLKLLHSSPEQGTSFEILFSIGSLDESEVSSSLDRGKSAELKAPMDGKKILLVEDAADNQVLFQYYLSETGARVAVAGNGKEGVEKAFTEDFDLVLLDLQMPVMDGYEAIRILRTSGFQKPVIALTAHAFKEERVKAEAAGFTSYLTKPVTKDVLLATLEEVLISPDHP